MTPFPFSPGEWNSHSLRNYNTEGFNQFAKSIQTDHAAFVKAFSQNIFQGGKFRKDLTG